MALQKGRKLLIVTKGVRLHDGGRREENSSHGYRRLRIKHRAKHNEEKKRVGRKARESACTKS